MHSHRPNLIAGGAQRRNGHSSLRAEAHRPSSFRSPFCGPMALPDAPFSKGGGYGQSPAQCFVDIPSIQETTLIRLGQASAVAFVHSVLCCLRRVVCGWRACTAILSQPADPNNRGRCIWQPVGHRRSQSRERTRLADGPASGGRQPSPASNLNPPRLKVGTPARCQSADAPEIGCGADPAHEEDATSPRLSGPRRRGAPVHGAIPG